MIFISDAVQSSLKEHLHCYPVLILEYLAALKFVRSHNLHVNSIFQVHVIEMFAIKVPSVLVIDSVNLKFDIVVIFLNMITFFPFIPLVSII